MFNKSIWNDRKCKCGILKSPSPFFTCFLRIFFRCSRGRLASTKWRCVVPKALFSQPSGVGPRMFSDPGKQQWKQDRLLMPRSDLRKQRALWYSGYWVNPRHLTGSCDAHRILTDGGFTRGSSFVKASFSTNSPFLPLPHWWKETLDFKKEQIQSPDFHTRELNRKTAIWIDHGN